jgi:hypothetical protein
MRAHLFFARRNFATAKARSCNVGACFYFARVKLLFTVFAALASFSLGSCAEDDTPPAEDVRQHLERGVTGQGQLGPIDREDDPYVTPREGSPNTHQ